MLFNVIVVLVLMCLITDTKIKNKSFYFRYEFNWIQVNLQTFKVINVGVREP